VDDSRLSVLHLVGLGPGGDDPGSLELLRGLQEHARSATHRVIVAGNSHHAQSVEHAGVHRAGHVPATLEFGGSGERALRRFIGKAR